MSFANFALFFGTPTLLAGALATANIPIPTEALSFSVSVFSIFAALLFSSQIAVYGFFRRQRREPEGAIDKRLWQEDLDDLRDFLSEVNSNISYLILISCIGLAAFLVMYIASISVRVETAIFHG